MPFKGLVLSKTGKIGGWLGIEIEEGKGISGREILYYGLSGFEKPAAFTPFLLSVYFLLFPHNLYVPFYYDFNKETRRLCNFLTMLKERELVKTVPLEETIEERFVYRYLREITREKGEEWRKTKERIKELSESLGVDKNKISTYTSIPEKRAKAIISGETFPTNSEVDELEKFFGKRIIYRWKKMNKDNAPAMVSILEKYQEKIIEGWENNPKGEALVQKYNLEPQTEFVFKSKSPWEVLEESVLTIHAILAYAINPTYPQDIRRGLGFSFEREIRTLVDYGILKEDSGKYYTSSIEFFETSVKRLFKQTEVYKLYIKVKNLKDMGMPLSEISTRLNLPLSTIKSWLYKGEKPIPLPSYVIELLRKRGMVSDKEIEEYKKYGLIR